MLAGILTLFLASVAPVGGAIGASADQSVEEGLPRPGFDSWGAAGRNGFYYHRLSGDCEALLHRHGRNAAWGYWRLPLAQVIEHGVEENDNGHAFVRFTCIDGGDCIRGGRHRNAQDALTNHIVPFETPALARQYIATVAALKSACVSGA